MWTWSSRMKRARWAEQAGRCRVCTALTRSRRACSPGQVVRIRDRRLGFLYWVFLAVIFGYVLMYRVVYQAGARPTSGVPHRRRAAHTSRAGYLKRESPVGTVRFSLLRPLQDPACDRPECPADFAPTTEVRARWRRCRRPMALWHQLLPARAPAPVLQAVCGPGAPEPAAVPLPGRGGHIFDRAALRLCKHAGHGEYRGAGHARGPRSQRKRCHG